MGRLRGFSISCQGLLGGPLTQPGIQFIILLVPNAKDLFIIRPLSPTVSSFSINVSDGTAGWVVAVDSDRGVVLSSRYKCHHNWTIANPGSKIIGPVTSLLSIINL